MNKDVSGQDNSKDFIKPLYIDYDGELKPLSAETPERQNLILSNMVTGLSKVLEDKIIVPPPEILIKARKQMDSLTRNMETGRQLTINQDGTESWNINERPRAKAVIEPSGEYEIWSYFKGRYDEKDEIDIRNDPEAWEFLLSELEFEEERGKSNIVFMVMFRRLGLNKTFPGMNEEDGEKRRDKERRKELYMHWKFINPKILTRIISSKTNDRGLIAEEVHESDMDEIIELFIKKSEAIRENYQAIKLNKDGSLKFPKFSTYVTTVIARELRKGKDKVDYINESIDELQPENEYDADFTEQDFDDGTLVKEVLYDLYKDKTSEEVDQIAEGNLYANENPNQKDVADWGGISDRTVRNFKNSPKSKYYRLKLRNQ